MGDSSHVIVRSHLAGARRRRVLLRLLRDDRLVALIRDGDDRAFEVLFDRYRPRLLGFCRGMLASAHDAEDVMQEVFAAAHTAILADRRELAVRPWLYRIARNRCLNHLRGLRPINPGSLDDQAHDNGASTADCAERRDELRALLESFRELPETQRGALLLRELDDLSYDEIARAMGTTTPAVKSLLVRARVTLAEASRARELTCAEVRLRLAEHAEGVRRCAGEVRHHLRHCEGCEAYRAHLRSTGRGIAALAPFGILATLQRWLGIELGGGAAGVAGPGGVAAGGAGASSGIAGSGAMASLLAGGIGLPASKLIATAAIATLVGAGASELAAHGDGRNRSGPTPTPPPALAEDPPEPFAPPAVTVAPSTEGTGHRENAPGATRESRPVERGLPRQAEDRPGEEAPAADQAAVPPEAPAGSPPATGDPAPTATEPYEVVGSEASAEGPRAPYTPAPGAEDWHAEDPDPAPPPTDESSSEPVAPPIEDGASPPGAEPVPGTLPAASA